jgi:hypothetical protein
MSWPYKVTVENPGHGSVVSAEDHVESKLDILPILSQEETAGIIVEDLGGRGFGVDEDSGNLVRERQGVRTEIDPLTGEIEISAEESADLPPPPDLPQSGCGCRVRAAQALRESSERDAKNDLQRKVTERLLGAVSRLGCEMEGLAHRVTKEALRRKASRLGEVKSISEDNKSGSMTIVVEV